jgi:hypothetical protein
MKKIVTVGLILLLLGAAVIGAQEKRIFNDGKIDYLPKNAKIQLYAEDMGSSLQYIEYSLNGGPIKRYEGPVAMTSEGRNFVAYRAIDKLGNVSIEKTYSCVVDDTPPYFSASANGPAFLEDGVAYGTSNTAVVLWAEDELSGVAAIYVSVDDSGFWKYTGPGYIEDEGKHVGKAYAVDNVGNRTKTYQVEAYVDNTPPRVTIKPAEALIDLQGSKYTTSANKFSVRAYDNVAGVKEILVSVDRGEYFTYTEPVSVQGAGFHSIRAKAVDYLDNASKAVELGFYIDTDLPDTGYEILID